MTGHPGPKALTDYIISQGEIKAKKRFFTLMVQGILAGFYISIGALGSLKVAASVSTPGLGDFFGALVFPLGIIAVLLMGAELFTSDCMVVSAVYAGRTRAGKILGILILVIFANLLGSIFIAYITEASGIFDGAVRELVVNKAVNKVQLPVGQLLISAILCNIIVCTGVCLAYSCKEEIAKVVVLWLAIVIFVLSGTEHVVANMYFLYAGFFCGAKLTAMDIFYNLSISGVGNFIGGGIIVSGINYLAAYK
ncbi:MAG: formate/nitrite transporter family protein [Clostridia bacterium]|nr:formate/nitrite transporter family protein [Clostridia bacterium]